jgi:hypothetical protein
MSGERMNPYTVRCPIRHCTWQIALPNAQAPTRAQSDAYGRHLAEHRDQFRTLLAIADNYAKDPR